MYFKHIGNNRYQVFNRQGGRLLGTVKEEMFTSYDYDDIEDEEGKEESFWTAQTRGCISIPARFLNRKDAADALIKQKE